MSRSGGRSDDPVAAQTDAVLRVLDAALPNGVLVAAVRYGSAVTGGLRRDSDVDLFGLLSRRLSDDEKRTIIRGLVPISSRTERPAEWRPVELTLVVADAVRPWRYPPQLEFQYGEWIRESLAGGHLEPVPSPDLAVVLTMVRATGVPIRGPAPGQLLDAVPPRDLVRAMLDEVPALLRDLDSDTRNVLLTLARMWSTVATGEIVTKDAAAAWAARRLPSANRPHLELARAAYLGEADDRWDDDPTIRSTATIMAERIRAAALTSHRLALPGPSASG